MPQNDKVFMLPALIGYPNKGRQRETMSLCWKEGLLS